MQHTCNCCGNPAFLNDGIFIDIHIPSKSEHDNYISYDLCPTCYSTIMMKVRELESNFKSGVIKEIYDETKNPPYAIKFSEQVSKVKTGSYDGLPCVFCGIPIISIPESHEAVLFHNKEYIGFKKYYGCPNCGAGIKLSKHGHNSKEFPDAEYTVFEWTLNKFYTVNIVKQNNNIDKDLLF